MIFPEFELSAALKLLPVCCATSRLFKVIFPLVVKIVNAFELETPLKVKLVKVRLPTQGFPDVPMVMALFAKLVWLVNVAPPPLTPFQPPCRVRLNPFNVSKSPPVNVEGVSVSEPPAVAVK